MNVSGPIRESFSGHLRNLQGLRANIFTGYVIISIWTTKIGGKWSFRQ